MWRAVAALAALAVIAAVVAVVSPSSVGPSSPSAASAALISSPPGSTTNSPTAPSSSTATPTPSLLPLDSILGSAPVRETAPEAAATIAVMFARYPSVAASDLTGSAHLALDQLAPDPRCYSMTDTRTYEAQASSCLVSFQALWQAYATSGDVGFLDASADVLWAIESSLPVSQYSRFGRDLRGLSAYLAAQPYP